MPRKKQASKKVQFSDQQQSERENEHKNKTIYCLCQKAASGFMLQCDRCKEWYHGACVKIEDKDVGNNTEYVCVMCSDTKCSELVNYPRKYVITRRLVGLNNDRSNLQQLSFCTCNSREDGRPMVRCSLCKEWYHTQCASIRGVNWDNLESVEMEKTAFACLQCTDERSHLLINEDLYYELCDKRRTHGAICENTSYNTPSNSSLLSLSRNVFLDSLVSSQSFRHKFSSSSSSLSNLQWNHFKTLATYDLHSWMDMAPYVLRRVPLSPLSSSLSLLSVGTNRGTVELFEFSPPDFSSSSEPIVQEKNWISNRVQNLHRGTLSSTLDDISAVEWTPDGSCVCVGTWSEGRIEIIDTIQNIPIRAFDGHNGLIRSLHIPSSSSLSSSSSSSSSFSLSNNTLISASHDKRVILWDLRSDGKKILQGHSGKVVGAKTLPSYSPHCIITAGDSTIRVWDVRKEDSCLHTISVPEDRPISSLDLSSTHLAVNTSPGSLFLFSNLSLFSPSSLPHCSTLKGYYNKLWSMGKVYFSADEKYLATGSEDGYLLVWDVKTGSLVYKSRTHSHWVWDLVWLPDSSSFSSPSVVTCSEDLTLAVSGVGPGSVYNRVHEWGPVGYKNLSVPYATKVFARWPNGRYYHGTVDHEVAGVGGMGRMSSVKFRGWHGPDSRATYEPISLFPDSSNCTCKKGHSAKDIPFVNSSLNIPLSPPPSPSVTPSPTISPTSSPRSHSTTTPILVTPTAEKRKRKSPAPATTSSSSSLSSSDSPPIPAPTRTSSFGRTIKKSRFLDSPPPSPKQSRKTKIVLPEVSTSETIEISPIKGNKRRSPRKSLLFSHTELIPPEPADECSQDGVSSEPSLSLSLSPSSSSSSLSSSSSFSFLSSSPSPSSSPSSPSTSSPTPISPQSVSTPVSMPSLNLPELPSFSIPWDTPATSSPIVPRYHIYSPASTPNNSYPSSPSSYPLSPLTPRTTSQSLPPISSLFNLSSPFRNSHQEGPINFSTTQTNTGTTPWLSPPKF